MHIIVSFVGKSSSGKTTLLEKLIIELSGRGYKVAIVKHSHHADDLDMAAKDTWRFTKAGSALSAINSLDHLAIYRHIDHYFDPGEISTSVTWDYDVILTEGFKGSSYPKIEVHRAEQGPELLTDPRLLMAVITDQPVDVKVPQFVHEDIHGIADFVEKIIVSRRAANDVDLVVNGNYVNLSPELRDVLSRTLLAMIPDRQDSEKIKNVHLSLRRMS
jgi:molybdopterin-guanine dinucleotide biosynthesis protein B